MSKEVPQPQPKKYQWYFDFPLQTPSIDKLSQPGGLVPYGGIRADLLLLLKDIIRDYVGIKYVPEEHRVLPKDPQLAISIDKDLVRMAWHSVKTEMMEKKDREMIIKYTERKESLIDSEEEIARLKKEISSLKQVLRDYTSTFG